MTLFTKDFFYMHKKVKTKLHICVFVYIIVNSDQKERAIFREIEIVGRNHLYMELYATYSIGRLEIYCYIASFKISCAVNFEP